MNADVVDQKLGFEIIRGLNHKIIPAYQLTSVFLQ
jgi:hypothetical protein